jgi:fused signal recognition particle receptor
VSDKPGKRGGFFGAFRRTVPAAGPADVAALDVHEPVVEVAQQPAVVVPDPTSEPPSEKRGWFQRLKAGLTKTSSRLSQDIAGIFTKRKLDADTLEELEDLLIQADLGIDTAMRITAALAKGRHNKEISPEEVRAVLAAEVERALLPVAKPFRVEGDQRPHVVLVVGVNGTGKTTTIGKIAHQLGQEGKSVMLAAGDTFRAAAIDQLKIWGDRTNAEVISGSVGADSAGLAFDALTRAREEKCDVLLIDTAGRLQNKQALMDELEKVLRVLRKIDPSAPHQVLLVLDATTGQNALNQVEVFKDKAGVTGLVMTKLDGTARGGILVAISAKFGLPVHAIGVGESIDDLSAFDAREFARAIALG